GPRDELGLTVLTSGVPSAGSTATCTVPTARPARSALPTSSPTIRVCCSWNGTSSAPNENDGAAPATLLATTTPTAPASAALWTLKLTAQVPRSISATFPSK